MENRNQHFMPRFMLRGFATRSKRREFWTCLFPRGREPGERNARDVGAQRDFYARGKDMRVDDALQKMESEFSAAVNHIRSAGAPAGSFR